MFAKNVEKQIDITEAVRRFGDIAERYCAVVEQAATLSRNEFLLKVYSMLPELIDKAIHLPLVTCDDNEEVNLEEETRARALEEQARMSHENWWQLLSMLKVKFADWDTYWMVFDPTKESEAIHGSLANDIADIYRDLKEGVFLAALNEYPKRNVIFEWRVGFDTHWGRHAVDALGVFHARSAEIQEEV